MIVGTSSFIQKGKKINFLILIMFHKITIPPAIEKGNKINMPKTMKVEFSDIKNNDSDFKKFNLTKNLSRHEYKTVNIVPNIININKNKFFPFINNISMIRSLE